MKYTTLLIMTVLVFIVPGTKAGQVEIEPTITEITLDRSQCFGRCPAYSITLHPDGTITYIGAAYVKRIGTYSGTGSTGDFKHTAELIQTSHFDQFKATYGDIPNDVQMTTVSFVSGGKRHAVLVEGNPPIPTSLWAIQIVIDAQANQVYDWKKIKSPKKQR